MDVMIVLSLYVLSVMRITRLINSDTILDRPRIWVARQAHNDDRSAAERRRWGTFSDFLSCPWCVGMWVSVIAGAVPVWMLGWPWWSAFPLGLSCSQVTGMTARIYNDDEIEFEPARAD